MNNQEAIDYFKKEIEYKSMAVSPLLEGINLECIQAYEAAIAALEYMERHNGDIERIGNLIASSMGKYREGVTD